MYSYDRTASAVHDPVLGKMQVSCGQALKAINSALELLNRRPDSKREPGSVYDEAYKDLKKAKGALEDLVGNSSPYIWGMIDPH